MNVKKVLKAIFIVVFPFLVTATIGTLFVLCETRTILIVTVFLIALIVFLGLFALAYDHLEN
jgi:hypothetical protein